MTNQTKTCICRDCSREFAFTPEQQQEFVHKRFSQPTRCPECHQKRNARRRHGRGADTSMHAAKCATCGKDAFVPFKPTADKPIYCDECFKVHRDAVAKPAENTFVLRKPERIQQEAVSPQNGFAQFKLHPHLERAIVDAGYDTPTPIQLSTIPLGMQGRDLIGTAQTGTGKTAAFALPILHHLLTNPVSEARTRVIVLTPTRELAEQINDSFKVLGKYTKIRTATVYGGVAMNPQERALRTGAEIIVACPGRLLDHMDRGNTDLRRVEKLVLDEADRMLDMGFLPSIKRILAKLPNERHSLLFSATFAPEIEQLVKDTLRDPQRIAEDLCAPAKTVAHVLYPCPQHLKTALLLKLLDQTDTNSVLIFTRTKHRANRIAMQIGRAGYTAGVLHSNKSQNQRQAALDDFRAGRCQILVATDIAARGLDVETISHVINYDIPDTSDTYIHRIGRTGRAEREGDAMTLVTKADAAIVFDIERTLGGPIECRKLDDFDYTVPAPAADEFKRPPMPPRRKTEPAKPAARPKTAGHFAERRKTAKRLH